MDNGQNGPNGPGETEDSNDIITAIRRDFAVVYTISTRVDTFLTSRERKYNNIKLLILLPTSHDFLPCGSIYFFIYYAICYHFILSHSYDDSGNNHYNKNNIFFDFWLI